MTEETKNKSRSGGGIGLVAIVLGVAGVFLSYLFIYLYLGPILIAETEAARECRLVAPFMIPAFACVGIVGGIFWLAAGVGFFQKKEWAYRLGIVAVVINLFANFWPNIPAMESGTAMPGPWFLLFVPNFLVYFYLVGRRGHESGKKALVGMIVGMAFILTFINGIAATTRMVNRLAELNPTLPDYSPAFMYMLTMPTNMLASFLLGYTTIGLFISKRKELVRMTGLTGAFLGISAGFPLAFYSMFFAGTSFGFSMFILGPIVSLLVALIFLSSKTMNKMLRITE
jgi:hypothetical protein